MLSRYQQGQINTQLIKDTLQFSLQIIEISKQYPYQLVAQLQLYRLSYSWSHNMIMNQIVATYLFLARNRWNDTCMQHLLCICVSQFAGVLCKLDKLPSKANLAEYWPSRQQLLQSNQTLMKLLKRAGLEVWCEGIRTAPQRWHHHPIAPLRHADRQSSVQQILSLGVVMARLITRHKHIKQPALSFSEASKRIARHLPTSLYPLYDSILQSPGLLPPGSFAKLNNGELVLVLSEHRGTVVGKSVDAGQVSQQISSFSSLKIKKAMPAQPLKALALCDTWWNDEWDTFLSENQMVTKDEEFLRIASYKIDKPPPTLLALQQTLQKNDFDTNEVAELILQEPVFATHIKQTATQSSRENLVIADVKHGLLMHGFERAGSILMEHALNVRLNQNPFPLREPLQQLCTVFKHCMGCLAEQTKLITVEQAHCWASFACAGFFTHTALKNQLKMTLADSASPKPHHLFQQEQSAQLNAHSNKLAHSWAQSPTLLDALQTLEREEEFTHKRKSVRHLALLLGCSTLLTRHLYFGRELLSSEQQYLQRAFEALRILHLPYSFIINEVLANSHCFVPLPRAIALVPST